MSNILTYIPTYISLTLNGGYIAIYDNTGTQQYYQNTDGTIELPYLSATPQWSYKIGKHAYKLITGTFTVTPSAGGTVTINPIYSPDNNVVNIDVSSVSAYTSFSTTQNIYDYLSYYRTTSAGLGYGDLIQYATGLSFLSSYNLVFKYNASQAFLYDGSTFTLKSSTLSGSAIVTTGNITLTGVNISNISITTANLSYGGTPINLNNVTVNGTLHYNTNTPATITYTSCTIGTLVNDGSANVLVRKINSTIATATDPEIQTYIPTYLSLTLLGGYIAIYNDSGVQQYYQNTDGTIELPYSANNTWTYKIGKFGYKLITGSFTINRSTGGTVTIAPVYVQDINISNTDVTSVSTYSDFSVTQKIYDYLSYYRTTSAGLGYGDLNLYANTLDVGSNNIILLDSASPAFSYDGSTFILHCGTLSGSQVKTNGTLSISGNSSITNITIAASATDKTPNDLTNVIINGTLIYNTNSPASITYTNCTVGTVVNNGTGNVLIKRVNSTINNATDPEIQNYAPTLINVIPNGGSVAIYNENIVRQYFITTDSSILLSPTASGRWAYRVAKYAQYAIKEMFDVNPSVGDTIIINPTYVSDLFITESNVANVSAYTDLTNAAKIHDYLSYYQTTSAGIDYGDIETESFGTLTFQNGLTLDANATQMVSANDSISVVLKSTNLTDNIILVSPSNFTKLNGNTISNGIKVRAANYDSELYFNNVDSIKFYPTEADRDNNNNIGLSGTSISIYRFKYGSVVNGITFSNYVYCRVTVGDATLLIKTPLVQGSNTIDFGTTGNLQTILNNQRIINTGVQKASKLIPHAVNI
jgi:hypothetical protein